MAQIFDRSANTLARASILGIVLLLSAVGAALMQLQRYPEALESLELSLALDPNDRASWFVKSIILDELGREQEAEEARARADSLDRRR